MNLLFLHDYLFHLPIYKITSNNCSGRRHQLRCLAWTIVLICYVLICRKPCNLFVWSRCDQTFGLIYVLWIKIGLILLCESALQVHDNKIVDNPLKPKKLIYYNQTKRNKHFFRYNLLSIVYFVNKNKTFSKNLALLGNIYGPCSWCK